MSGRFRTVQVFAPGTVEFDGFLVRNVGETEGEEGLTVTEDSRASSEISFLVLVDLRARGRERLNSAMIFKRLHARRYVLTILPSPRDVMMNRA